MYTVTFHPLGNADTCLFELPDNRLMLFDYANMADLSDKQEKRINLEQAVREKVTRSKKTSLDILAFTHADSDHIKGFSDLFYLDHASKYQGEGRIKISQLWVPAAIILEEGAEDEARILRAEARYRLKNGNGIRVFSRPDRLKEWLKKEGIKLEDRRGVITDAGKLVPGFDGENDGIQIFVHSPFAEHSEENYTDRNESALILHVTFTVKGVKTKMFLIGDTTYEILQDIISITKRKRNETRLEWDIFDIPHHCSYKALAEDKGEKITAPIKEIERLFDSGADRCILVSCSDIIKEKDSTQPPHFQAANYYRNVADEKNGQFLVTMEFPTPQNPSPIIITIDEHGAMVNKKIESPAIIATSQATPRAGK